MIEPTGYTALDLVGFTDRGTYAANVNYVKNDLVHYGGNIWRILIDDTIGITPAEGPNYTLFIGEPTNLIERIIAPLEDNPATVAYQTGRQIIYNDYLYEVIQDIAIGDVLIAYEDDPTNANIKLASPVETQVLALNASKVNKSDVVNNVTTTTAGKVLDARQGKALQDGKTDNSVIAPVESGATASRAYAIGAHFIRDSAFCTAKTAIAQGETFTLNTNYTAEDIGQKIKNLEETKANDFTIRGTVNGTNVFNMPSGWKEALIQVVYAGNTFLNSYHLSNEYYQSTPTDTSLGNYGTSFAIGKISKETFQISQVSWAGHDMTQSSKAYIYTR